MQPIDSRGGNENGAAPARQRETRTAQMLFFSTVPPPTVNSCYNAAHFDNCSDNLKILCCLDISLVSQPFSDLQVFDPSMRSVRKSSFPQKKTSAYPNTDWLMVTKVWSCARCDCSSDVQWPAPLQRQFRTDDFLSLRSKTTVVTDKVVFVPRNLRVQARPCEA